MSLNDMNSHPREPPSRSTSGMKALMSWTHPIQSEWSESRAGQLVQSLVWTSGVQEKTELCVKAAVRWCSGQRCTTWLHPWCHPWCLSGDCFRTMRHLFFFPFHPHWIWCLFCSDCRLFGFFRHNQRVRAPWWMQSTDSFTHTKRSSFHCDGPSLWSLDTGSVKDCSVVTSVGVFQEPQSIIHLM